MIKRFFAPFRAKVAQAEQQGFGVFFLELYFYVLILGRIALSIQRIASLFSRFFELKGQPWYLIFDNTNALIFLIVDAVSICLLIWEYFELRVFSSRFFIALGSLTALVLFDRIRVVFIDPTIIWDVFVIIGIYGLIIYYFYKRKGLFTKKHKTSAS